MKNTPFISIKTLVFIPIKIIALVLLVIAIILGLNYFNSSIKTFSDKTGVKLITSPAIVSVLNWNVGYAGLGKESDFIMDGGENLLPPSVEVVIKNLGGIQGLLTKHHADFVIIQEASKPDMLNLGLDVLGDIVYALPDYNWLFSYDISTRFVPMSQAVKHGLISMTRVKTDPVQIVRLPLEPTRIQGIIQRQYHMQLREFTDENGQEWALFNLHLSAFDEGGNVRMKQLTRVMEIAEDYYARGKHVIVGGDWNMQLAPTDFAYTTSKEDLFWLAVFPQDKVKPGWQIVVDASVPTVRSNERPYIKGENYTTVIDGFLVSPNVKTLSVTTIDTGFEFTDHQPVRAVFTAQ